MNFFSYFLIPISALFFSYGTNWFHSNFSVIGSSDDKRLEFFMLGILIGSYFYISIHKIITFIPQHNKEALLIHISFLFFVLAIITPYLPDSFPVQSVLHVVFAFCSALLLIICLYMVVFRLYLKNRSIYRPFLRFLHFNTMISALLLLFTGIVCSALEIFFITASGILVNRLLKRSKQLNSQFKIPYHED